MSDDSNLVHGAMRVLTEFSREVTDTQIPQVAPIVLPQMCIILTEDKVRMCELNSFPGKKKSLIFGWMLKK